VSPVGAWDGPALTDGLALIVNPAATRVGVDTAARVRSALGPGSPRPVVATSAADTIVEARRARDAGARVVAVVGGDGTVGAVAAVLAGTEVALLPLSGGSTNVFARGLGWDADLWRALAQVPGGLRAPRRTLRLGEVILDGRPARTMCVNAGVGVDAATVRWVESHPRAKRTLRQVAFAAAAVGPGARALARGRVLRVGAGPGPLVPAATCMVACGHPYAFVGPRPLELMPRADWDGVLEWLALARPSPAAAAAALLGGLGDGAHLALAPLMGGTTRGEVRIAAPRGAHVQVDGEALGPVRTAVVRPGPLLRVVAPPAPPPVPGHPAPGVKPAAAPAE